MSLRELLRTGTRAEQQRLDETLGLESPALTRAAFGRYLQGMRAFCTGVEPAFRRREVVALGVDMVGRSKLAALDEDLQYLGLDVVARWARPMPPLRSAAQVLGCAYVLEGSTLGAATLYDPIARRLGLGPHAGASHLFGYGPATGSMWKRFVAMLDAAPLEEPARLECLESARATFCCLEEGFRDTGWLPSGRVVTPVVFPRARDRQAAR
jgi:heme oxygenase